MGKPALDYHVCHRGMYASIETKAPGKKPTPRQVNTMREQARADASIFLIDSVDGTDIFQLKVWLACPVKAYRSQLAHAAITQQDAT